MELQRLLHGDHRTIDAGAVAARVGEQDASALISHTAMVGAPPGPPPRMRQAPRSGVKALVGCVGRGPVGHAVVMAREIPEVVRAAAGLAATVLDEARKLPATLPGLPVRVIGFAMQKAMWAQQQYSGLVARGDEVFTGLRGEDEPGLATFDEDLPDDDAPAATGFRESAFDRAEAPSEEDLLSGLPEDDVALPDASAAEEADAEVRAAFADNRAEAALDEIALEALVDDETAGLPPEPAPAEVVAAVEDITAQVADADVLSGTPDADQPGTEDAAALENALLESDAAGTTGEPGVADPGVSDQVDVLTPDGGVETVEATVTDEG